MSVAYEDNFGFWNIELAEDEAFFEDVRRRSVQRTCGRCESSVQLLPHTTLCARCVSALEYGAPHSITSSGYGPDDFSALQDDPRRGDLAIDIAKTRRKS